MIEREPLFAGKVIQSRDYSALCALCLLWWQIASVPDTERGSIKVEKLMKHEGWTESEVVGWTCPACSVTIVGSS